MLGWNERKRRLGLRLQSLGRALEDPGRLRRKLTGVHVDEEIARLASRPYLRANSVRTILDVGANEGQFARTALRVFPSAQVICFEPLPSVQASLRALATESQGRVQLQPFALGEHDGQTEFHISSFSPSSSVLSFDQPLAALGDQIKTTSTVLVPVRRLSAWATSGSIADDIIMKLDVQGYEARVLRGAGELLTRSRIVIAETTFAPIYSGQASLGELCSILEPHGLKYREAFGVIRDGTSGEPLWQDSVFART